jgi:hypothetical protein
MKILNLDNIFIIGNYMMKLDTANTRLFVINKNTEGAYDILLEENTETVGIMVLTDDVYDPISIFEGLEEQTIDESNYTQYFTDGSCPYKPVKAQDKAQNEVWSTLKMDEHEFNEPPPYPCNVGWNPCSGDLVDYEHDYKSVYQRFVIYYRIFVKAKSYDQCSGNNPIWPETVKKDIHISSTIDYDVKCRGIQTQNYNQTSYTGEHTWLPYHGAHRLSRFRFTSDCQTKHTWESSYNHNVQLHIEDWY